LPPTVTPSIRSVGWPTPTGTPWPSLPQVPTPGVEHHVVADHADLLQHVRAVADQGGALDRGPDLAVLDEIGLGGAEDELARGDVDLAAAEIDGVEPLLDRGQDLLRVAVPRQQQFCQTEYRCGQQPELTLADHIGTHLVAGAAR